MANIKKSFNFRSGVQVDDDNLVVSPTGLIGIGTTVPTQALDIRGDFVCSGLSSAVKGRPRRTVPTHRHAEEYSHPGLRQDSYSLMWGDR